MDEETRVAFSSLRDHIDKKFADLSCVKNTVAIAEVKQSIADDKEHANTSRDWFKVFMSIGVAVTGVGVLILAILNYSK